MSKRRPDSYNKMVLRYCLGAVIAGTITAAIYIVVLNELIAGMATMASVIIGAALLQLGVQLAFFLHITGGEKPRWRLHSFWFVAVMIVVVVVGSIWIMRNLDYNMGMSPEQMQKYMLEENKKGF